MKNKKDQEPAFTNIRVKVVPRSSRNAVAGKDGEVYRIKIASPPVDGAANRSLIAFLAKKLGLPKRSIRIVSGETSRMKTVRITGLSRAVILRMLGHGSSPLSQPPSPGLGERVG
jgi:hypothetical protein